MNTPILSPSILSADFADLGTEVRAVLAGGAGAIHIDVMDHHFVPNLSFGAPICASLRKAGIDAFMDVHLMVERPEHYIDAFAKAGANLITFHPETTDDIDRTLDKIQAAGMQAGLAFNPDKLVDITPEQLTRLSLILLMSVFPGFGGQAFIPDALDKIKQTRELLDTHNSTAYLGVDGGLNVKTIGPVAQAGADFFVVGSALFSAEDYEVRLQELTAAITT